MARKFRIDRAIQHAILTCSISIAGNSSAWAQATSRLCVEGQDERPGPACLMAHQPLGTFSRPSVSWQLFTYDDMATATREQPPNSTVALAFGQVWLFFVGPESFVPKNGKRVAEVGPIPVEANTIYAAEYLKSTFNPGMEAPVHVHSGPEAFYAISGDTCIETPDGVQFGKGPGNTLFVRGGPPMLLMAPGPDPRTGFAMILHDNTRAPTTLVKTWTPKGLCKGSTDIGNADR